MEASLAGKTHKDGAPICVGKVLVATSGGRFLAAHPEEADD